MTLFATLDCCVTTLSTKIADIFIKLNVLMLIGSEMNVH